MLRHVGLRVGTDIVDLSEVADAYRAFGESYLRAVASTLERETWPSAKRALVRRVAETFAAKEAVLKVIGLSADTVRWNDIELRPHASGEWGVTLRREAAALAARAGVAEIFVSVGSTSGVAVATAVGATRKEPNGHGATHPERD